MFNSKRTRVRVAFASALAASYLLWSIARLRFDDTSRPSLQPDQPLPQMQLPCRSLPGTDEVLIILRSGSTELNDRLAIHLSTSVRCFPNYLIFSDLEENYGEEHILDALADVDPGIVKENPDFELYRRLQKGGRISLTPSELAGPPDTFASLSGKTDNPGWKLDKWKFLPMVNKTLHERPNMKWYVFVEADIFLLWSALQRYLDLLDPTEPIYAGSPTFVGGVMFAHGGSGFVVSQPALRMVVNHYATHKAEIEKFTDSHWAGDCVLGKAFTDSGIPLTNAWPAMQGDYPGIVQYAGAVGSDEDTSRLWCGISVSYHHMSAAMIEELWVFEQDWAAKNDPSIDTLRHRDIFTSFVMPQMMVPRDGWDNLSDQDEGTVATVDECRLRCMVQPGCMQYSLNQDQLCRTRGDPRLGKAMRGVTSGWIEDRIKDFEQGMAQCGSESRPTQMLT